MTARFDITMKARSMEGVTQLLEMIREQIYHCVQNGEGKNTMGDTFSYTTHGDLEGKPWEDDDDEEDDEEEEQPQPTPTGKKAALVYYDGGRHNKSCRCGNCDPTTREYVAVGVYDVSTLPIHLFCRENWDTLEKEINDHLHPDHVCYAPSQEQAYAKAREWARAHGDEVVVG